MPLNQSDLQFNLAMFAFFYRQLSYAATISLFPLFPIIIFFSDCHELKLSCTKKKKTKWKIYHLHLLCNSAAACTIFIHTTEALCIGQFARLVNFLCLITVHSSHIFTLLLIYIMYTTFVFQDYIIVLTFIDTHK